MAQRLRCTTAIGQAGQGWTEYELRAELVKSNANNWMLTVTVNGTASDNFEFNRQLLRQGIRVANNSVKDAKLQANALLRQVAARFLNVPGAKLAGMDTTWVDDSD